MTEPLGDSLGGTSGRVGEMTFFEQGLCLRSSDEAYRSGPKLLSLDIGLKTSDSTGKRSFEGGSLGWGTSWGPGRCG